MLNCSSWVGLDCNSAVCQTLFVLIMLLQQFLQLYNHSMHRLAQTEIQLFSTKRTIQYLIYTKLALSALTIVLVLQKIFLIVIKPTTLAAFGISSYLILFSYLQKRSLWKGFLQVSLFYKCLLVQLFLVLFQVAFCSALSITLWLIYFKLQTQKEARQRKSKLRIMKDTTIEVSVKLLISLQWSLILLRVEQKISLPWENVLFLVWVTAILGIGFLIMFSVLALCTEEGIVNIDAFRGYSSQQKSRKYKLIIPFLWTTYFNLVSVAIEPIVRVSYFTNILSLLTALNFIQIIAYKLYQTKLIKYANPDFIGQFVIRSINIERQHKKTSSRQVMIANLSQTQTDNQCFQCLICSHQATVIHNCGSFVFCQDCYAKYSQKKSFCPRCKQYPLSFYKCHSKQEVGATLPNSTLANIMSKGQYLIIQVA